MKDYALRYFENLLYWNGDLPFESNKDKLNKREQEIIEKCARFVKEEYVPDVLIHYGPDFENVSCNQYEPEGVTWLA